MAFNVVWHERAAGDLKSFDRMITRKIVERVMNHLALDAENLGKPLPGVLKGLFRYRWGDYRVIYMFDRTEGRVSVLRVTEMANKIRRS